MSVTRKTAVRAALLAATSFSTFAISAPAWADQASAGEAYRLDASNAIRSMVANTRNWTPTLRIVTNDSRFIKPGPGNPATGANYANSANVLSTGVNGIGQMITVDQVDSKSAFLGLCTGTLINPRTVITAAHCVYDQPAINYGSQTGAAGGLYGQVAQDLGKTNGIPISFGFSSTNRCIDTNGCARGTGPYETWRDAGFTSQPDKFIYNGNQVWYGRASQPVSLGGGGEFGNEDIALVTLDTHVENVPTWTLLFTPLSGPTHVTITGYGGAGVGTPGIGDLAGIDYRRRAAENMIDALMSSADWVHTPAIGGPDDHSFDNEAHALYWFDFDDPDFNAHHLPDNFFNNTATGTRPDGSPNDNGYYDFNGLGGTALPREGTTAGGDSGGPLIVDQTFRNPDGTFRPVVAGVLTGSWSFDGGIATYGEFSVYPPLYLYWQEIVANNPYKYVSAKGGNGNWFDPAHWVQDMDPAYSVVVNGQLVNSLPSTPQQNADSTAGRFGQVCFLGDSCGTIAGTPYPANTGQYLQTPGGPGTTNFVPNNVEPVNSVSASSFRQARYYDVTLRQAGTTTLSAAATIDQLTINGGLDTQLNIASTGNLRVWSDFNQYGGWTNVNGRLTTGEALVASGILSGSGVFDPTYLTVVGGAVAPGGGGIGTLTISGNVIMASASGLVVDLSHTAGDRLNVISDSATAGALALNGGALRVSSLAGSNAARAGDRFMIANAAGRITGTFGSVGVDSGSLVPTVSYGPDQVTVTLSAGSLARTVAGTDKTTMAFAGALDALRTTSYGKLWNLYGSVDWMDSSELAATFAALSPTRLIGETELLQERQSRQLFGSVGDRLSLLGTGQAAGFALSGTAASFDRLGQQTTPEAILGLQSSSAPVTAKLAGGLSGFVTMGGDNVRSSYGDARELDAGQHSRYFASGIEAPFGNVRIGTAVGYAEANTSASRDSARSKLTQAAAYAAVPLGKNAYFGGIVAAERASSQSNRLATDTVSMFRLDGATHSSRYMATAEVGVREEIGHGLALTPRAQLGFSHYSMGGFREEGGETALELNSLKVDRFESRIGAKLDGTTHIAGWTVTPQVQADYVRLLSGGRNGLSVSFAAAPDYDFSLPLTNGGSGWMEVKGGIELNRGSFSLGLSGQATAGDAPISDQRGLVSVGYRF